MTSATKERLSIVEKALESYVNPSGKFAVKVSCTLKPLETTTAKTKEEDEEDEFIRTSFLPRVPKVMASSLRGNTGQRYINEHLFTREVPKWFKELDSFERETFDELNVILENHENIDPVEVFEMLDGLDIDITQNEVNEALDKARDFITKRIDICELLFELCDSEEYLQRMKKNKALYEQQKIGEYTKRQMLFYSIISIATFPEFPKDPIIYRVQCHYKPHVLRYFTMAAKTFGLSTRQIKKKTEVYEKIAACWRQSVKSAYNETILFPPEPPLVRQQRLRKERKKTRAAKKPAPRSKPQIKTKEVEKEKGKELLLSDKISILATRAYRWMEKPVRRYPPEDWVHHNSTRISVPLPLMRFHPDFVAAMRKFHVNCFDLPNIGKKIEFSQSIYYDALKAVLVEQSLRHWISTYAVLYKDKKLNQEFATYFRRYSPVTKEEAHVMNPWLKPNYWQSIFGMHAPIPFV